MQTSQRFEAAKSGPSFLLASAPRWLCESLLRGSQGMRMHPARRLRAQPKIHLQMWIIRSAAPSRGMKPQGFIFDIVNGF